MVKSTQKVDLPPIGPQEPQKCGRPRTIIPLAVGSAPSKDDQDWSGDHPATPTLAPTDAFADTPTDAPTDDLEDEVAFVPADEAPQVPVASRTTQAHSTTAQSHSTAAQFHSTTARAPSTTKRARAKAPTRKAAAPLKRKRAPIMAAMHSLPVSTHRDPAPSPTVPANKARSRTVPPNKHILKLLDDLSTVEGDSTAYSEEPDSDDECIDLIIHSTCLTLTANK